VPQVFDTPLLHLIHFAEPFGLSVVEAMACGTPVIAYPCGSMPELVEHGTSGFLVADEAAAVTAVSRLATLDRAAVRLLAERFPYSRMVDAYLTAYRSILLCKSAPKWDPIPKASQPNVFAC